MGGIPVHRSDDPLRSGLPWAWTERVGWWPLKPIALLLVALGVLGAGRPFPAADGDVDDDGRVTRLDLRLVRSCRRVDPASEPACAAADVDADGDVDRRDLRLVARQVGLSVCNGSPALCARRYDEVAYATSHNAFATLEEGYFPPANQTFTMTRQLEDGVRALMLDAWYYDADGDGRSDGAFLCHTLPFCGNPPRRLAEGLAEIGAFLDAQRGEVVTLIFESYVAAADVAASFAEAGLLELLHVHEGGAWPTLGEMIARGERLVVLTDDRPSDADAARFPWYHYQWDALVFETPFALSPEELPDPGFSCAHNRGDPANDLFILNHFLTRTVGHPTFAELVNFDPFFIDRARECEAWHGRIPNFVTVDYYELGDLFGVVDALNGLDGRTTRKGWKRNDRRRRLGR